MKNTKKGAKKNSEIEHLEEDRRRKCTTFIPANLHDYQNDVGISPLGEGDVCSVAARGLGLGLSDMAQREHKHRLVAIFDRGFQVGKSVSEILCGRSYHLN